MPTPATVSAPSRPHLARVLFWLAVAVVLTPIASPGLALALGLAIGLTTGTPYPQAGKRVGRLLLHGSVALLGVGIDLPALAAAARTGFALALASILLVFLLGEALRRLLALRAPVALLLSAGTAICGGSAIAAVAAAIAAEEEDISVAMGTVFLLNAAALYLFPPLGHLWGLTPHQFGTWSGIAIHDISSVVGAATAYGQDALPTATAVKLSRTLWIIPVALVAGLAARRAGAAAGARAPVPWFIGLFVLAALASACLPPVQRAAPVLLAAARTGLSLTLLLIGAGLSRTALRAVGIRPVLHGLGLWLAIAIAALYAARGMAPA